MPTPKHLARGRREWGSGFRAQLMTGSDMFCESWGEFPSTEPTKRRLTGLEDLPAHVLNEMDTCWRDCGEQILAECVELIPGSRPWFNWIRHLLPESPRLRTSDAFTFDCSHELPLSSGADSRDGFESGPQYLTRRQLWLPGERQRLAALESRRAIA